MKSQVAGERKGDLTMDTTVARIYAQKLNAQEENPTVVDDSQNQGVSALSSDVAAMLESFDAWVLAAWSEKNHRSNYWLHDIQTKPPRRGSV